MLASNLTQACSLPKNKSLFVLFMVDCMLIAVLPLGAATLTVTSLNDSGPGTLRQLLNDAAPGDTITFGVQGVLGLTSGPLTNRNSVRIVGPGSDALQLDAGRKSSVMKIFGFGSSVTISDLTIRNGSSMSELTGEGGGVYNEADLTMVRCVVTDCEAYRVGGGISTFNSLKLDRCTLRNNRAGCGGAISGGAEMNECSIVGNSAVDRREPHGGWGGGLQGTLLATNSSFFGNTASGGAAGVSSYYSRLVGCSIEGNRAYTEPGGIGANTLESKDTVIRNNQASSGGPQDFKGKLINVGNTVLGNTNGCTFGAYRLNAPKTVTGGLQISFQGIQKGCYEIWTSPDLKVWTRLGIMTEVSVGTYRFTENSVVNGSRFYRLRIP